MKKAICVKNAQVPNPLEDAAKVVEERQREINELRLWLELHDAVGTISEAINCYLIDRYGSMHKAREKDKAYEEAEHAEYMDEQYRERAEEV